MFSSQTLSACRGCGGRGLIRVVDLGEQFLTGVFPATLEQHVSCGPLRLVWCDSCHLVQLDHTYDASEMYGDNYGYRSGLNRSMVDHLSNKVHALERIAGLRAGDLVIDIGSNDGTLLNSYRTTGLRKIGVDPTADKFRRYYHDAEVVVDFFSRQRVVDTIGSDARAALITSIAMFYDLDSPRSFIGDIRDSLAPDGLWHFEQSYMPSMLRLTSYDTICHEHLEFYSFSVIHQMLEAEGMKVIDVCMNAVNGGSCAVTAAHRDSHHPEASDICSWILSREAHLGVGNPATYRDFERRIWEHRQEMRSLMRSLAQTGRRIIGCGASTKGNVILQFCGLGSDEIIAITDVNEDKWGRVTPGTGIPIVPETEGRSLNPDYMLVLPWHFKEVIIQRERAFLERGGKLIFPLPEIEIVGF